MKTVNVAELKANLSRYLRAVQQGERLAVVSRKRVVAELVPTRRVSLSTWERLAAEGKCTSPKRKLSSIRVSRVARPVPYMEALRWVQGEP